MSEGKKLIWSVVSGWNCFECAKISRTTSLTNRLFGFSYGLLKNTTKSAQIKFFIKKILFERKFQSVTKKPPLAEQKIIYNNKNSTSLNGKE